MSRKNKLSDLKAEESQVIQWIPIGDILPSTVQPRRFYSERSLAKLAESIKEKGVLQPILLRPVAAGLELVAGERRVKAADDAGLEEVPCLIQQLTDLQAVEIALIENLQREDLNAFEETEGILRLLSLNLGLDLDATAATLQRLRIAMVRQNVLSQSDEEVLAKIQEVFDLVGRLSWQSFVTSRLRLLTLPEDVKQVLREGLLDYTKGKEIGRVPSQAVRKRLLDEAIAGLSLEEIRIKVKAILSKSVPKKPPKAVKELQGVIGKIRRSPTVWNDQDKVKRLEEILGELKGLI